MQNLTIQCLCFTGNIPNRCSLRGRGLSSGEPQQHHDTDKKKNSLFRSKHRHRGIGKKPHHCCSDCGKSFAKQDLTIHEQIHTGEKPFHCSRCGKSFTASKTLKSHQRIHTGERPSPYFDCEKCFKQSGSQTTQKHTGQPYSCDQCGNRFNQSGGLTRQQRIHTAERPNRCDKCGKSFNQSGYLTIHKRIQTGERTYSCVK